ncbi:MAG TPA: ZIP family metal transporter [Pirellulales bacterium]|nr:ZIP family metal transporter [Pirellulales bacterium]
MASPQENTLPQTALLTIYCLLIAGAALLGGWLPMLLRLTHTGMQLAMSFIGGVMLGVGILHLLPHAYFELHDIYPCVWWMLGGFLTMFFIERVFHFHHHDAPDGSARAGGDEIEHDHDHTTDHAHAHHHGHAHAPGRSQNRAWQGALVGLALHSAADGMALAASVAAETEHEGPGPVFAGLAVFLVIWLHIPFDSLALSTLMTVSHATGRARHVANFLFALAVPLGAVLFLFGAQHALGPDQPILGAALAFSAGTFLCIATSDLLPELQFHAHDRVKLSAALLLGLALAAGMVIVESSTHDHGHEPEHDHGPAVEHIDHHEHVHE